MCECVYKLHIDTETNSKPLYFHSTHKQKQFNQTLYCNTVHEILTSGGWAVLITHLPFVCFLMNFVEKLDDPEYVKKVFKKTIWKQ